MELVDILKMVAPGTQIREGIENILNAKTGGLIVIGDGKEVLNILDGGFYVNVEFTVYIKPAFKTYKDFLPYITIDIHIMLNIEVSLSKFSVYVHVLRLTLQPGQQNASD